MCKFKKLPVGLILVGFWAATAARPSLGQTVAAPPSIASTVTEAATPATATNLDAWRRDVDALLDAEEFRHSHWGMLAVELKSGRTLYERNADKLFAPASVTKLFSVAAALDGLGAEHRIVTPVFAKGAIDAAGRLDGDLILVAKGDPTFGGRTGVDGRMAFKNVDHTYAGFSSAAELTVEDPLAGMNELAKKIFDAGIRDVRGEVLVDDRHYVHALGSGSGPDLLTPIMVNDNVLDFTVSPAAVAEGKASVVWRPKTTAFRIDAVVDTVAADTPTRVYVTEPEHGQIVVRGTIAVGRAPLVLVHKVDDPASFARSLFIEALRRAGVQTSASPLTWNDDDRLPPSETYATLKPTAELQSPPLAESARLILKVSHNLHAGTLPLLIAADNGKRTLADGLRLQRSFLERVGIDVGAVSFGGGAGGDRADYVTPRVTVQLLTAMSKRDDFSIYREALPRLGVDGTLHNAVDEKSPARDRVRAKTGTLVWSDLMNHRQLLQSKALAGYVEAADDRTIVFAGMVNLVPLKSSSDRERMGRVLGVIAEKLYASPAADATPSDAKPVEAKPATP